MDDTYHFVHVDSLALDQLNVHGDSLSSSSPMSTSVAPSLSHFPRAFLMSASILWRIASLAARWQISVQRAPWRITRA